MVKKLYHAKSLENCLLSGEKTTLPACESDIQNQTYNQNQTTSTGEILTMKRIHFLCTTQVSGKEHKYEIFK